MKGRKQENTWARYFLFRSHNPPVLYKTKRSRLHPGQFINSSLGCLDTNRTEGNFIRYEIPKLIFTNIKNTIIVQQLHSTQRGSAIAVECFAKIKPWQNLHFHVNAMNNCMAKQSDFSTTTCSVPFHTNKYHL